MTKADVVSEIAANTNVPREDVQKVVESFFGVVKGHMNKGTNVYFRGFGSFILKSRAKKIARNIAKGTSLEIPPHAVPAFKPAKSFVEEVKANVKQVEKKTKRTSKASAK